MGRIFSIRIEHEQNKTFDGIFAYMQNVTKSSSLVKSKVLNLNASRLNNVEVPITGNRGTFWTSLDIDDEKFYQIHFPKHSIQLEHIEYYSTSNDYFSEMNILGSVDGIEWIVLKRAIYEKKPNGGGTHNEIFFI